MGFTAPDVSYLITQELTTQSRRQLVSCKYVNTGKRCCNAQGRGADKHPWSRGGGGSPGSPHAGRWTARNPNEKRLPNEINQAGGGAAAVGDPVGGWWCAQLEGGEG